MSGISVGSNATLRGRLELQSAITAVLDAAAVQRGGVLFLRGDVGVGKTALLEWAAAEASTFLVLRVDGSVEESTLPYAALHQILAPLAGQVADMPPYQAHLLSLFLDTGFSLDGGSFALSAAVLDLLKIAAAQRPVLCCIDDAHWTDRPSWNVLLFVARRLRGQRIAMLFSGIDQGHLVEPTSDLPTVRVRELDHPTSCDVLADVTAGGLAGDVAGTIATLSGGNPAALVELANGLTPEQRRGSTPPPTTLPPGSPLLAVLRQRLSALPSHARWLLLLAAVDAELDLTALWRASRLCGIDLNSFEAVERADLVRFHDAALTFVPPLMRTVIYDEATLAQRRAAHRVLAQILDRHSQPLRHYLHLAAVAEGPDGDLADALANAASAAGLDRADASRGFERAALLSADPVVGAGRLIAAAREALTAGAAYRARSLLRGLHTVALPSRVRAEADLLLGEIELQDGATASAQQTLLAAAVGLGHDRHLALNALMQASEALCASGEYPQVVDVARRALTMRATEDPPATELLMEQFAGMAAMFGGDYDAGTQALRRVVALAEDVGDPVALIRATIAALVLGDDIHGYGLACRAVATARSTEDALSVPRALEVAAAAEFGLGRYAATERTLLEAYALARATGQDALAGTILANLALVAGVVGDRELCLRRVREARARASSYGVTRAKALTDWALAALDLIDGRPAVALDRLKELATHRSGRGQMMVRMTATPHLVEAAIRCGDRISAGRSLARFAPWAMNTNSPTWQALLARCQALMAHGDDESDRYFEEALRLHLAGGSDFDWARTALLYGQELRRSRRPAAAREHLRHALETFQRYEAPLWIDQAMIELRASGESVEHRSTPLSEALTAQQWEIARLVADGATNREIGERLFISPRTVDHHLRNIFARLGIRSRIDLSRLFDERSDVVSPVVAARYPS